MDMKNTIRMCGRDPSCALVLEHPTVSRHHAQIELCDDGLLRLREEPSGNGLFLHRNDNWIRVRQVTLCIGDRIRFGDFEVPLERLTAVFGTNSDVRLEAKHFALKRPSRSLPTKSGHGAALKQPRRNPVTGKIEDQRSDQTTAS
jgi:pSer/pThr/pTyr-binding forkhead associated (FHA) protein